MCTCNHAVTREVLGQIWAFKLTVFVYSALIWFHHDRIEIDTSISVIVVSLTTWEAHHSPRAKPSGCGELPRLLMRQQWPQYWYQFLYPPPLPWPQPFTPTSTPTLTPTLCDGYTNNGGNSASSPQHGPTVSTRWSGCPYSQKLSPARSP